MEVRVAIALIGLVATSQEIALKIERLLGGSGGSGRHVSSLLQRGCLFIADTA